jgi:small subunit ribosomal protein S16
MLTIRLQRTGARNAASFRIVVAEKTAHVSKKFNEVLGHYNPRSKDFNIKNSERLNYWVGKNIELSPTVHNLLLTKGLIKGDKVQARKLIKKEEPKVEEAPAAPVAAAEPAPAAPAEETSTETATETPASAPAAEAPSAEPEKPADAPAPVEEPKA